MKAAVNTMTCRGCGFCARMARDVFAMNTEGKAEARDIEISEDAMEFVEMAAEECSENSIILF